MRLKQDLSKIIEAVQFSGDATLNSAHFASKSLASSIAARRLVWLHHWQADARHKWRLASVPFTGNKLFGDPLQPFLVETKLKERSCLWLSVGESLVFHCMHIGPSFESWMRELVHLVLRVILSQDSRDPKTGSQGPL